MTAKLRTLIEPQDIIGLEYECMHCHARYGVPIERFDRRITHCPNCKEEWLQGKVPSGSAISNDQLLAEFVERLRAVQTRTFGAAIRLEINGEAKPEDTKP